VLVLENVTKSFGGLRAVSGVSFTVPDRAVFGLIGPNGAGKTTVFNLITGVYKHDEGSIGFAKTDLAPLAPAQIAGVGVGRTFQNIRLFGQLSVLENLLVACELQKKAHLGAAILRLASHYDDERSMTARALELLRVFDLHQMADARSTSLSYGNQRRLEIARAMMTKPKVLLLDEPAAGMNYGEAEGLKSQIRWLRDTFAIAVVLVEHNMQVVMGVCEEIHVLDHGETIAHGTPEEIKVHPKVLAAYLGEVEEDAASVREVAAELSRPDLSKVAPPAPSSSSPAGGVHRVSELPSSSATARLLSAGEATDLRLELTRNLERGLSRLDAAELPKLPRTTPTPPTPVPEASPFAPPPHPSSGHLSNVDRGWSDNLPAAVPPVVSSVPDVAALDTGWGSERNLSPRPKPDDARDAKNAKKER
jgi:branched-chain amino acid transport system ATP-binding protein